MSKYDEAKLAVLAKLGKGELTLEAANAALEELEATKHTKPITIKRTEDGKMKISLYGTQKQFPVTQWVGQWKRILEGVPALSDEYPLGKIQALIGVMEAEAEAEELKKLVAPKEGQAEAA